MTVNFRRWNSRANLAVRVVLPTPFTPTSKMTVVEPGNGSGSGCATGLKSVTISSRNAATRVARSLICSLRDLWRNRSTTRVVAVTPTSARIKASSSASYAASSRVTRDPPNSLKKRVPNDSRARCGTAFTRLASLDNSGFTVTKADR